MNKPDKPQNELSRLSQMSDDEIDTSDIPVVQDWRRAERGRFYHSDATDNLPLYLDKDVLEFITQRARDRGIQPHELANEMLKKDIEMVRSAEAQ
ncbi:hypothetical protein [Spectribacter hydrogenoxidans]|uniref:BrnA antitoxin of type II toxin-antitoxin system n=1 Tax=Spectribacter hydrogenoxidans TaxID=3075608 RepID=A0ABU3C3X1_9GAMM|nr:hypothetical protein [Salinisphaera sp. W335]MDT0636249.1 hypothetical protein [Salinisphaera sp. W335]